jgi:ethanolamine ammonia-lyase large subunit
MGIPGSDDIMLNYQTTSFHDALYVRRVLGLQAAPEFEAWLRKMDIVGSEGRLNEALPPAFQAALLRLS